MPLPDLLGDRVHRELYGIETFGTAAIGMLAHAGMLQLRPMRELPRIKIEREPLTARLAGGFRYIRHRPELLMVACLGLVVGGTTRPAMERERRTFIWVLKNWRSRMGFPVLTRASVTASEVGFGGMTWSRVRAW